MNRYQCPVCNAISDNKITDSCDECLPVFEEMMNKFTIQDLSNEEADELMEKLNGQRYVILYRWGIVNDGNDWNYYC